MKGSMPPIVSAYKLVGTPFSGKKTNDASTKPGKVIVCTRSHNHCGCLRYFFVSIDPLAGSQSRALFWFAVAADWSSSRRTGHVRGRCRRAAKRLLLWHSGRREREAYRWRDRLEPD